MTGCPVCKKAFLHEVDDNNAPHPRLEDMQRHLTFHQLEALGLQTIPPKTLSPEEAEDLIKQGTTT